jgi:hypothetical protein
LKGHNTFSIVNGNLVLSNLAQGEHTIQLSGKAKLSHADSTPKGYPYFDINVINSTGDFDSYKSSFKINLGLAPNVTISGSSNYVTNKGVATLSITSYSSKFAVSYSLDGKQALDLPAQSGLIHQVSLDNLTDGSHTLQLMSLMILEILEQQKRTLQ